MKTKYIRPRPNGKGLVFNMPLDILKSGVLFHDTTDSGFIGTATNGPTLAYPGIRLVQANAHFVDIGVGPTSVSTTALWAKWDDFTLSNVAVDLNGTDFVSTAPATGVITASGFAGGTTILYLDAVVATSGVATITAGVWTHVVVTDTVAKNASDFDIGRRNAVEFDGCIADVRLYNRALSSAEVSSLFELQRWKFQVQ